LNPLLPKFEFGNFTCGQHISYHPLSAMRLPQFQIKWLRICSSSACGSSFTLLLGDFGLPLCFTSPSLWQLFVRLGLQCHYSPRLQKSVLGTGAMPLSTDQYRFRINLRRLNEILLDGRPGCCLHPHQLCHRYGPASRQPLDHRFLPPYIGASQSSSPGNLAAYLTRQTIRSQINDNPRTVFSRI
jgi:hypothetical protein